MEESSTKLAEVIEIIAIKNELNCVIHLSHDFYIPILICDNIIT